MCPIWLLALVVLPSVRATVECNIACGLCAIDKKPATAACKLCRECHKVRLRMMGFNKQMLSRQHNKQLEDLEKKEFKQVMKEYGWAPQDLVDNDTELERLNDDENPETETYEAEATSEVDADCVPLSHCINQNEGPIQTKLSRTTKTVFPTLPASRNCPRIQPCKKTLVKKIKLDKDKSTRPATQSTVPVMILKHIVTFNYEPDKERPTTPDCHEPDTDYESPSPIKLLKKTTSEPTTKPTTSCVPCMSMCPLPCFLVTQSPPLIPQEALEALMTVKPTTILDYKVSSSAESDEENLEKMVQKKRKYEDTTKDYVYLYVGVPKDYKHARYG